MFDDDCFLISKCPILAYLIVNILLMKSCSNKLEVTETKIKIKNQRQKLFHYEFSSQTVTLTITKDYPTSSRITSAKTNKFI